MLENLKIAMIDDDEVFIEVINGLVKNHEIIGFSSSKAALSALRKEKYSLLILDYFVDELNGSDIVKKIREFDKEIFILMLTGHSEDIPALQALESLQIQDYCEKDVKNLSSIVVRIESALKSISHIKELSVERPREGFPERLKKLRIQNKELQEDLAELIGVSRQSIGCYESGKSEPDIETLKSLARHFKVSVDFLVGY